VGGTISCQEPTLPLDCHEPLIFRQPAEHHRKTIKHYHEAGGKRGPRLFVTGLTRDGLRHLRMQPDAERSGDFKDRGEARISLGAERLVETLAIQTCLFGDLRHPFGAGDIAECSGDARRVVPRFGQPSVEIRRRLVCAQIRTDYMDRRLFLSVKIRVSSVASAPSAFAPSFRPGLCRSPF
jgi:hypothetical protein